MNPSQATANPTRGTIRILAGTDAEGTDLPLEHDLAPWPIDQYAEKIARDCLTGMGWSVVGGYHITNASDGEFVLEVVPAQGRPSPTEATTGKA